jgi:Peptidase family M28/PDZ domain
MLPISSLLRLPFLLLAVILAAGLAPVAGAPAGERDFSREEKSALAVITKKRAKKHIVYLCGMKCEGRASGEKGCEVAADYLAKELEEMGVEPGGENGGYFQEFPIKAGPFPGQGRRTGREVAQSTTRNVIGVIKGSDPKLSKELIVLGGHYDHLGFRDLRKRKVYWGACDNAAGTVATMMVAEAFAKAEVKPRRSLMFILFSGEERGLFGSKRYCQQPTWPMRDTVAMINVDMIGRNKPNELDVYGKGTGPALDEANERYAKASKFRFTYKGGSVFARSDHYSFYEKKVPVLFFTCGIYNDYHDLDDEAKRLNFGQIERIAEHCWRMLRDIGDREKRPEFHEVEPTGAAGVLGTVLLSLSRSQLEELKLGKKKGAVSVTEVRPGKPGAEAGIQPNDLILGLAGKYLTDKDPMGELDKLADDLKPGRKYTMLLLRNGKREKVGVRIP